MTDLERNILLRVSARFWIFTMISLQITKEQICNLLKNDNILNIKISLLLI